MTKLEKIGRNIRQSVSIMAVMLLVLTSTAIAQSEEWEPVTGEENLSNFMSGTTLECEEPG